MGSIVRKKGVLRGLIYIELQVFQYGCMTPSPNITLQVTKIAMKIGITLKIYFDWK